MVREVSREPHSVVAVRVYEADHMALGMVIEAVASNVAKS